MQVQQAPEALRSLVEQQGRSVSQLTAAEAVRLMIDWYCSEAAEDAESDMLLVQWGVYDWGSGPAFEYDITRQMTTEAEDGEGMWQVHLTLYYDATEAARAVRADDRWCSDRSELDDFRSFIEAAPATAFARANTPSTSVLGFEDAG